MASVIIVEEDSSSANNYVTSLMAGGYEVRVAKDGEEALSLAISQKPKLIFAANKMPTIGSIQISSILDSTPTLQGVTVVIFNDGSNQPEQTTLTTKVYHMEYSDPLTPANVTELADRFTGKPKNVSPPVPAPEPVQTPQAPPAPEPLALAPAPVASPAVAPAPAPLLATPAPVAAPAPAMTVQPIVAPQITVAPSPLPQASHFPVANAQPTPVASYQSEPINPLAPETVISPQAPTQQS